MINYTRTLSGNNLTDIKLKMLSWAQNRFSIFSFLDNNHYPSADHCCECMLAIAGDNYVLCENNDCFTAIRRFHENHPGWLFGHISYPTGNKKEALFPSAFFFKPDILIVLKDNTISIQTVWPDAATLIDEIQRTEIRSNSLIQTYRGNWKSSTSRNEYTQCLQRILQHIQRGDCYEMNFCMEYLLENEIQCPVSLFQSIKQASPNPFSAFYRINDAYAFCASPERFLQRKNDIIISQPIKGTAKRNRSDEKADEVIRQSLINSPKERSENVMIVDLVRNDMSKIAIEGSVRVRELMGIYTFPHVHHLISTVEAKVYKNLHWTNIVEACFPMGSMTGAPKKRVIELTEQYEKTARGLYSGSIGYVTPEGDFDFNVVIRSIFYDDQHKRVSCKVGSGITIHSNPDREYEECDAKIDAIKSLFSPIVV